MKHKNARLLLMMPIAALFSVFFSACVSTGSSSARMAAAGKDLDTAVKEAAEQMEARLPSKTMIALVSVASPSTSFSTQVLTRLESVIVSGGKLIVVDRANLDKIRAEQGFQLSEEVDDESAKSIGKLLGAGAIVTGTLTDLGDVYSLALKAINIETATVAVSYLADLSKTSRIETLLASRDGAASGQTYPARSQAGAAGSLSSTAPEEPQAPIYKIGDRGPAGGLVFYDKGNNSNGWRYLEAAPDDIDQKLYAVRESIQPKTEQSVGSGKLNTQVIMREANNRGGGFGWAAQACDALVINGFDDWFLPSRDELNYMYGNLYLKNLGNFKNERYWTSTHMPTNAYGSSNCWWNQDFTTGTQYYGHGYFGTGEADGTRNQYRVRACRQF